MENKYSKAYKLIHAEDLCRHSVNINLMAHPVIKQYIITLYHCSVTFHKVVSVLNIVYQITLQYPSPFSHFYFTLKLGVWRNCLIGLNRNITIQYYNFYIFSAWPRTTFLLISCIAICILSAVIKIPHFVMIAGFFHYVR